MQTVRIIIVGAALVGWTAAGLFGQASSGERPTQTQATYGVSDSGAISSAGGQATAVGGSSGTATGYSGVPRSSSSAAFGRSSSVATSEPYAMQVAVGAGMPRPSVAVVPTSKVDPNAFSSVADGMRVMSHILRQNLAKGQGPMTMVFTDYGDLLGGDRGRLDGLYVQGYGVFLFAEVRLAQPPQPDPAGAVLAKDAAADPVWERAEQELNGEAEGDPMDMGPRYGGPGGMGYGAVTVQTGQPVEGGWEAQDLVAELIRTFEHAANIRPLGADELVTLSVTGKVSPGGPQRTVVRRHVVMGGRPVPGAVEHRDRVAGPGTTTFTLQARKSDIDQFSRGQWSLDQFKAKVRQFTY